MSLILKSLFVCLLLSQPVIAINSDSVQNPLPTIETDLDVKSVNGSAVYTLKGSDKPYTGIALRTNKHWKDVVIKYSFVDGNFSDIRTYYKKSTDEKLNGTFEVSYPDGGKSVITLVNGKQDGLTTNWYPNGSLRSKHKYSMKGEANDYETYYRNGNKKQTGSRKPDGLIEWQDWNERGYKERFFKFNALGSPPIEFGQWDAEGGKTGFWIERYDDGSLKKEKFYSYGRPERRWTSWYDNGNKNTEVNFAFGLLNGSFKLWSKEGVLLVSGDFKDSKEVGRWRFKDNNGIKIDRPKDLNINITDDGESIAIAGQANEATGMEAIYISIYVPLALALLVLLPLLGAGFYWLYRRLRDKKRNKVAA